MHLFEISEKSKCNQTFSRECIKKTLHVSKWGIFLWLSHWRTPLKRKIVRGILYEFSIAENGKGVIARNSFCDVKKTILEICLIEVFDMVRTVRTKVPKLHLNQFRIFRAWSPFPCLFSFRQFWTSASTWIVETRYVFSCLETVLQLQQLTSLWARKFSLRILFSTRYIDIIFI